MNNLTISAVEKISYSDLVKEAVIGWLQVMDTIGFEPGPKLLEIKLGEGLNRCKGSQEALAQSIIEATENKSQYFYPPKNATLPTPQLNRKTDKQLIEELKKVESEMNKLKKRLAEIISALED